MDKEIQYVGDTGQTLKVSVITPTGLVWDTATGGGSFVAVTGVLTNKTINLTEGHPGFYTANFDIPTTYPYYTIIIYNSAGEYIASGTLKVDSSSGQVVVQ